MARLDQINGAATCLADRSPDHQLISISENFPEDSKRDRGDRSGKPLDTVRCTRAHALAGALATTRAWQNVNSSAARQFRSRTHSNVSVRARPCALACVFSKNVCIDDRGWRAGDRCRTPAEWLALRGVVGGRPTTAVENLPTFDPIIF